MRWVIGDVHGMLKPLRRLIDEMDRIDPAAKLYFVGDYINRGPESRGVIDLLLTLTNARFCRGNHDDVFDLVLSGLSFADNSAGGDRVGAIKWFMQHGLIQTFASYGADFATLERMTRSATPAQLKLLVDLVPAEHRKFIRNLRACIEDDDLFILHAFYPVDRPDVEPKIIFRTTSDGDLRTRMLWGRYDFDAIAADKVWKKTGYFGHTPSHNYVESGATNQPLVGNKLVLVDTAAALATDGRLTAYCVETQQYLQADPSGELTKTI